ncbi:MAG: hypothetical protein AAF320_03390 [Myxococcota bacterium]
MNQKSKRVTCFAFAACMLLQGCAGDNNDKNSNNGTTSNATNDKQQNQNNSKGKQGSQTLKPNTQEASKFQKKIQSNTQNVSAAVKDSDIMSNIKKTYQCSLQLNDTVSSHENVLANDSDKHQGAATTVAGADEEFNPAKIQAQLKQCSANEKKFLLSTFQASEKLLCGALQSKNPETLQQDMINLQKGTQDAASKLNISQNSTCPLIKAIFEDDAFNEAFQGFSEPAFEEGVSSNASAPKASHTAAAPERAHHAHVSKKASASH